VVGASAERREARRRSRGVAAASLIVATALLAGGCGSGSDDEAPPLVRDKTLTVSMPSDPAAGSLPFQQALLTDLAKRLDLEVVFQPSEPGTQTQALLHHRADAAAPVPIRTRTTAAVAFTAPYFSDPGTGTLYGIAVLAGPDPKKDTALQEDLDEALSEMKDDGTLQKLYDTWFSGADVPDPVLNDATG
jgi:hypothetical protein